MLIGFEILGISRAHIGALIVPYKDVLEVCPCVDAICGEMPEPCSGAFCHVKWQVLDDEEIIVCPTYSIGKAEVFQPYGRVGVSRVLDDIRQRVEARREWCLPDPF